MYICLMICVYRAVDYPRERERELVASSSSSAGLKRSGVESKSLTKLSMSQDRVSTPFGLSAFSRGFNSHSQEIHRNPFKQKIDMT